MNATEVETRRNAGAMFDQAEDIIRGAVAAGRDLSRGEQHKVEELKAKGTELIDGCRALEAQRSGEIVRAAERLGLELDGVTRSEPGQRPTPRVPKAVVDELWDNYRSNRNEPVMVSDAMRTVSAPSAATQQIPDVRNFRAYDVRYDRLRIANLMPTDVTALSAVPYFRETTGSTAAATVAPGADKPESSSVWAATSAPVRKIAHYSDANKEDLDDYQGFQQLVGSSLMSGLISQENAQVLAGDGTGTNLTGLKNQSGVLTYAPGAAEARIFSILKAQTLLQQGSAYEDQADYVLMNPVDWQIYRLSTASGSGEFMDETSSSRPDPRSAWGIPVRTTNRLSAGTAIVANLADAAVPYFREAPSIFLDPYSQSKANKVRMICEERLALTVPRPTAVCVVTFNGTA